MPFVDRGPRKPFADVGERDVLLDPATHLGDYTLAVTLGPRSRFGGFRTEGELTFDARHIAVLARFDRGELYDSRHLDDLPQAAVATGLFRTLAVEPQRSGESAGDGTEYVMMLVTKHAGPPRTLAAGAGYGTGEGALIASAVLGAAEQGASLAFRRSNPDRRDRNALDWETQSASCVTDSLTQPIGGARGTH